MSCPSLSLYSYSLLTHSLFYPSVCACVHSPVMHSAIRTTAAKMGMMTTGYTPRRTYAEVADRRTIDEIHRKEGVAPGQKGTCPHASAGIAASRRADQLAKEHREQQQQQTQAGQSTQPTSFETVRSSSKQDARDAAASPSTSSSSNTPSMMMNSANPLFDYNAFYAEELDKKHKDKSYR